MSYKRLMSQHFAEKVYLAYNDVYKTGRPNPGFHYQVIRKDGARRDVSVSVALSRDKEGKPIGFRGILRDITKQKQLEETTTTGIQDGSHWTFGRRDRARLQ